MTTFDTVMTCILLKTIGFLVTFDRWGTNSALQNVETRGKGRIFDPSGVGRIRLTAILMRRFHLRLMIFLPFAEMEVPNRQGKAADLAVVYCESGSAEGI